jgi:hypothetical protein
MDNQSKLISLQNKLEFLRLCKPDFLWEKEEKEEWLISLLQIKKEIESIIPEYFKGIPEEV